MTTTTNPIRAWRESVGATQEEAAREMGVSLRTFQRWERGERRPRGLQRERLETTLAGGQRVLDQIHREIEQQKGKT